MAWTAEERLTLAYLKLLFKEQGEVCREIQSLIRADVQEEAFFHVLRREGVAGLVYFALSQNSSAKALLTSQIVTELSNGYYCQTRQNVLLLDHLAGVLQHFEKAGIKTIVWKGAALAQGVYPSPGIRGMCDVDLVVRETDFAKAQQVLQDIGFSALSPSPYLFSAHGLLLDLHTDIVNSSGSIKARSYAVNMDIEELWQRGIPWRSDCTSIRLLSPCDDVLTLIGHLQRHSFSRLIWFMDIAQLVSHSEKLGLWSEDEWDELLEKAKAFNLLRGLYFTLHFLHDVLEFPVPSRILQRCALLRLNLLEWTLFRMLLVGRKFEPWGELLFFFSIPRFADKLRFLRDLFSPRPDTSFPARNISRIPGEGYLIQVVKTMRLVTHSLVRAVKGSVWG